MPGIANAEMAAGWDGLHGVHWAQHWAHYDRCLAPYHERLLAAAAVAAEENVLDIGCGNGQLSRAAARAARLGTVLGLDLSTPMLRRARALARAEGLTNLRFEHADVQVHRFSPASFDLAVSRFGAMFFGDPVAAFANIGSSLRAGGRLAMVAWQPGAHNEWATEIRGVAASVVDLPDLPPVGSPGPFGLADPVGGTEVLAAAGFRDIDWESLELPFWAGDTAQEAFEHYRSVPSIAPLLDSLGERELRLIDERLLATMVDHETRDAVVFASAGWLIRANWPGGAG